MKIVPMSVEYVDHMGSDLSVVNAARVSFDKQSDWEVSSNAKFSGDEEIHILSGKDEKLIAYLAKHNHWSPFAHCSVSFRCKAPIFVARQLVKHQVGLSWNEVSRRYVDSEPEFYFPEEWRGKPVNAKQGSSKWEQDQGVRDILVEAFGSCAKEALSIYLLGIKNGMAPEQARMILPLNTMTEWIWTGSLYAFARVCNQRLDAHAQEETREVAQKISDIIQPLFPVSWKVLVDAS